MSRNRRGGAKSEDDYDERFEPTAAQVAASMPGMSAYWDPSHRAPQDEGSRPDSPMDPAALQAALPFDFHTPIGSHMSFQSQPNFDTGSMFGEASNHDYGESDRMPLTSEVQPISVSLSMGNPDPQSRNSFQTVSSLDTNPGRGRNTLSPHDQDMETNMASLRHHSYGKSLGPEDFRSSRGGAALQSAGSIIRAMSQRVVNISGDSEMMERRSSHNRSRSPSFDGPRPRNTATSSIFADTSYPTEGFPPSSPGEKRDGQSHFSIPIREPSPTRLPPPNPLKGKSLGLFSANNPIRLWLCDILVNPFTEPIILILILAQTILLAVEAAPNVFTEGNGRFKPWAHDPINWAMLGLFIIFTIELMARIIVSGFVLNAAEYSTIDRKKGVGSAIADQYRAIFQPQKAKAIRGSRQVQTEPSAIARSFTTFWQAQQSQPKTVEDQQRYQLARRAFLRHSFNRFDFLAVLAFWIDLVITLSGFSTKHHLHVFKMISCLRILRLLALTHGTAVSIGCCTLYY